MSESSPAATSTKRGVPVLATLLVLLAVATMLGLGAWQLQRARWKAGLLQRYALAEKSPPIVWPTIPVADGALPLFRQATGNCLLPVGHRAIAGENRDGDTGYVHIVDCATGAEGPGMSVQLGWSKDPNAKFVWRGGPVRGIIVPDRISRMRLVSAVAPAGLQPSAVPSVASASAVSPAGHKGYAATWFALALAALVIYAIAIVKRVRGR